MKWINVGVFGLTGVYTFLCALYVAGAYASGLTLGRWATAATYVWIAASGAMFFAGTLSAFAKIAGARLALGAALTLAILALVSLIEVTISGSQSVQPGIRLHVNFFRVFLGLIVPAVLATVSVSLSLRSLKLE